MEMVVGVRFRNVGKIYYFNPKDYKVKVGDHVIVETARGVEYGRVVLEPRAVKEDEVVHPLKEVLRVATKEDEEHEAENRLKEKELPPDISSMEYVRDLIAAVPTSARSLKPWEALGISRATYYRKLKCDPDLAK